MIAFLFRRVLVAALLVVFVSLISFSLVFASGNPAARLAGEGSAADAARLSVEHGFDDPILLQYGRWLTGVVRGDFGDSLYFSRPVAELLSQHFPATAKLGLAAMAFALLLAIPLGVLAGMRKGSLADRATMLLSACAQAMPPFCLAFLLIIVFSVRNQWLPASGFDTWKHYVMPVVALGLFAMPAMLRLMKSEMETVLATDYIRTARAMGLGGPSVVLKYALRNALRPLVSLAAAQMGTLLAGSVVIETVFAINGAGLLAWTSILRGDFPTMQALILIFALIYIVLTLVADLINGWLDPRVRAAS